MIERLAAVVCRALPLGFVMSSACASSSGATAGASNSSATAASSDTTGEGSASAVGRVCPTPDECPWRVELGETVSVFAGPESAEVLARDATAPFGWPVALVDPKGSAKRAQLVCPEEATWIGVFVERAALRPVVTEFVVATSEPGRRESGGAVPDVGLSLVPGTPVRVVGEKGDDVEVAIEVETVAGSGWIPKAALGHAFREPAKDPRALPNHDRTRRQWDDAVTVLDAPRGRPIAKVQGPVQIQRLGEPRERHLLAAINFVLEERTYAIGWVPEEALAKDAPAMPGGVVAGYMPPVGPPVAVPAGAKLVSDGGTVLGLVRAATELPCVDECDGPTPIVEVRCVARFRVKVVPSVP
jgi:hypothetical protein